MPIAAATDIMVANEHFASSDPTAILKNGHATLDVMQQISSAPPNSRKSNSVSALADRCQFQSIPDRMQHERFFEDCVRLLLEKAVFQSTGRETPVCNWKHPEDLEKIFQFGLNKEPSSHEELMQRMNDVIEYSVKTGHPYFMNQLFSSVDPYGLIGQWLGDALNSSVYTYEVAPVFTLMEQHVLAQVRHLLFSSRNEGDGIFCPGGSIANGYAINCARYHMFPSVKSKGLCGLPRLVLFTSNDAHYSIKKLASFEGIGADNVYLVKTDGRGKMDVNDLEHKIQKSISESAVPFMVSATAGTTVLGAFDPISKIADVCQRYNLWLHVDAAWGGGVMFSKHHRHLLEGIQRADSVTFNPHKMLTAPQQCSIFITRHNSILDSCHSCSAEYLFQKDKFYDTSYDVGDKHIQCGRRADVLKFWFMWKAKGTDGFQQHVDHIFNCAQYFTAKIKSRNDFELVLSEPECTNVCFWYIPPSLRARKADPDYKQALNSVAPKLKQRMMVEGSMMITYQPLNDLPNFFRLVIQNSSLTYSDMDYIIEKFELLSKDL